MKEIKRLDGSIGYEIDISDMIGKVFSSITNNDDEELVFENDVEKFVFNHHQD